jgi:hypothetical protein
MAGWQFGQLSFSAVIEVHHEQVSHTIASRSIEQLPAIW